MSPRVEWLTLAGDPDTWRSLGFVVTDDGRLPLYGTSLRIVAPSSDADAATSGITGWTLSGVPDASTPSAIDGLPTTVAAASTPTFADHPVTAIGLDHVVVLTPDLERTSTAIAEATGCELKRVREVGTMRQGFHRVGSGGLIVELVERPDVPDGPATFWGVVINVDDLDAACERIGLDRISAPKDAVQPGRRIATVRNDVGLGLPVALMTP
jgi:predicted enzyme related to lactoylglutathione lyase